MATKSALAKRASSAGSAAGAKARKEVAAMKVRSDAARLKARSSQNMTRQAVGGVIAAGAIGYAAHHGYLKNVPKIAGLPTTVTLAVAGLAVGEYAGGKVGDVARIIGIGAGCVAAFQLATGQVVSGEVGAENGDDAVRSEMKRLKAQLDAVSGGGDVVEHDTPIAVGFVQF